MTTERITLSLLPGSYAVVRLDAASPWPAWALDAPGFVALTRTAEELSIICRQEVVPVGAQSRGGWRALIVHGPFPFDAVGVLASLAGPLAEAGVSVLAVSTYDTDYLLVLEEQLAGAMAALSSRHTVLDRPGE